MGPPQTLPLGIIPAACGSGVVRAKPIFARTARTSADQTGIGTSYTDITGLSFDVRASRAYWFDFYILASASAGTVGVDVAVNGPASPTQLNYTQGYFNGAASMAWRPATAYDNNSASTVSQGTTAGWYRVFGLIIPSVAGTLVARIRAEPGSGGTCNVLTGSWAMIAEV